MFRDFSNMSKTTILKNSSLLQIIFQNSNVESEHHKECQIAEKAYPLLTELDVTQCLIKYILIPYLTGANGNDSPIAGKTAKEAKLVPLLTIFQTGTATNEAEPTHCPFSQ